MDNTNIQNVDQANNYVATADKLVTSWSLLKSKNERYDEAINLYVSASNIYKICKLWEKVIETQIKMMNIYKIMKDTHEEIRTLMNVAKLYKDIDTEKAIEYFTKVIEKNVDIKDGIRSNAIIWQEIGDILAQSQSKIKNCEKYTNRIIDAYTNSAKMYVIENRTYGGVNVLVKITNICLNMNRYKQAANVFDEIITHCTKNDNPSNIWSIRSHMVNSILCSLINDELEITEDKLDKYRKAFSPFKGSVDDIFLSTLLAAIFEKDEDLFKQTIISRDFSERLNDTTCKMLLEITEKHMDPYCKNCVRDELDLT